MNDEQSQNWYQMSRKATVLLCQGHAKYQPDINPLFQVIVHPSFDPTVSWEICGPIGANNSYAVVRSQWDEDSDLKRFQEREALLPIKKKYLPPLEPTIKIRTFELPEEWCLATMGELKKIQIPVYNEGVLRDETGQEWAIIDGTSYELAFKAGYVNARFCWDEDTPGSWRVLHNFVRTVLGKVNALPLD